MYIIYIHNMYRNSKLSARLGIYLFTRYILNYSMETLFTFIYRYMETLFTFIYKIYIELQKQETICKIRAHERSLEDSAVIYIHLQDMYIELQKWAIMQDSRTSLEDSAFK